MVLIVCFHSESEYMDSECFYCGLQSIVHLLARCAQDNIGYIDWNPHMPMVRLRSFSVWVLF